MIYVCMSFLSLLFCLGEQDDGQPGHLYPFLLSLLLAL